MRTFIHINVIVTMLWFAGCGTGEPKGQDLPAPLQESSSEQDEPPAAKESEESEESEEYVFETFPGNKVEVSGVSIDIRSHFFPPTTDSLEIIVGRLVGREDTYWIECGGVELEIIGSRLSASGLNYEISDGDSIVMDTTGVVFINGKKRTKVGFEDMHYITQSRFSGILPRDKWPASFSDRVAMLLTGHAILEGRRTVLLWRQFRDNPQGTDMERFAMLTLELDDPLPGKVLTFPSQQARGFYTEGSSSWGGGWYCDNPIGTLKIDDWPGDGTAIVTVDISLKLIDPAPDEGDENANTIKFNKVLRLSEITRDELTSWLNGGSGFRPDSDPRVVDEIEESSVPGTNGT